MDTSKIDFGYHTQMEDTMRCHTKVVFGTGYSKCAFFHLSFLFWWWLSPSLPAHVGKCAPVVTEGMSQATSSRFKLNFPR